MQAAWHPLRRVWLLKAVNREQADKELAYFKKLLTGRSFELPVAVDIEDEVQKPLGKAALTDLTATC